MSNDQIKFTVFGDEYSISMQGGATGVYITTSHRTFSNMADAIRDEIEYAVIESGDTVEDNAELIDAAVAKAVREINRRHS